MTDYIVLPYDNSQILLPYQVGQIQLRGIFTCDQWIETTLDIFKEDIPGVSESVVEAFRAWMQNELRPIFGNEPMNRVLLSREFDLTHTGHHIFLVFESFHRAQIKLSKENKKNNE